MSHWDEQQQATVCECGCGTVIDSWKSYARNHHMRDPRVVAKVHSDESDRARGESVSLHHVYNPETAEKMSRSHTGVPLSPEHRDAIIEGVREGYRKDPTIAEGISTQLSGRIRSEDHCRHISEAKIQYYKMHPETARENSEYQKAQYKNPDFCKQYAEWHNKKPNGTESFLLGLLTEDFPGLFQFTGDGKVWINGRNPDFVCESKKLIIELFGYYWHYPEDEDTKITHYENSGYSCLVIWADGWLDIISDYNKIKNWILESKS
jgi:very-short-patch-repair endonuclease